MSTGFAAEPTENWAVGSILRSGDERLIGHELGIRSILGRRFATQTTKDDWIVRQIRWPSFGARASEPGHVQ